ncbi:MAG: PQQ-binding-like beta-propeller repeat protein [Caldimonas sp.]
MFLTRFPLLAFALLTSCAAPAPQTGAVAGADRATASTRERADAIDGVKFTFRSDGPIRGTPLVRAGAVYFGSGDGSVYALDARSGALRWRFATRGAVMSSPAAADGRLYVSSRDGHLYCLDAASGALRWRHRFAADLGAQNYWDYLLSSPTIVGDRVFIGAGDGHLYAFDAASGRIAWTFDAGARIRSTPAVGNGLVVVGTMAGRVVAVAAASGALQWSFASDGAAQTFADKGNDTTSIFASPVLAGALVTVGARDGSLYALELASGKLAWRSTHDGSSWILSSAFDGDTLYVGSGSALIVQAADPATGTERWRFKTRGAVFSSIAIARDTLLFSDFTGTLYAIDSRNGASRWQFPMGGRSLSTPVVADGVVYAASDSGVLFALSVAPAAPTPTAKSAPRRLVYWEGMKSPAAYGWFRNGVDGAILGQLKGAGYEQVTSAELVAFMRGATGASGPSVVVFADDRMPAELLDATAGVPLVRKYLESGGKVVLLGPNPAIYKTDPVSGELVDIDTAAPDPIFAVRYPAPNIAGGFYASTPTPAGRAIGMRSFAIGYQPLDPGTQGDRFTALALDEFGNASAWLKGYGGRPGTGLLQLAVSRQDVADLSEVQAAIEYGVGW